MRKAKLSVHKSDVQSIIRAYSIEVPANSLDDLAEVSVLTTSVRPTKSYDLTS